MKNGTFIFAQKIIGEERKAIAGIIAEATGTNPQYEGVPSFAYTAGGWRIEKSGFIKSPEIDIGEIEHFKNVLEAFKTAGLSADGDASIVLSAEGHTGGSLRNLCNIIGSKATLFRKALGRENDVIPEAMVQTLNETAIETTDDFIRVFNSGIEGAKYLNSGDLDFQQLPQAIGFDFFNATLSFDEVLAYVTFIYKLNEQAKVLKHTSGKQKAIDNDKYAMRCFLLRLGFIGEDSKVERKVLLSKLEGNSNFKKMKDFDI